MYAGQVVETGPVAEIFGRPRMPYTAGLIGSILRLGNSGGGQRLRTIPGQVPSLSELPSGCRFSTRCPHAQPECVETQPQLEWISDEHEVRCMRWQELDLATETIS